MATRVITDLDEETVALLDRVARSQGQTREAYAALAIRRVAEHESDFLDFIQAGIDSADNEPMIPHEKVMEELEAMIEEHRLKWLK
jgi:predicted transcriptional regulator